MNLLALTTCCVDYYPQKDCFYMGGNSLNVASMWRQIDTLSNISVITCLGTDRNGKVIQDFFSQTGIDVSRVYVKDGVTANNQLRVDAYGERYGIEGTWNGGLYETFLLSAKDWKWVAQQDIVAMPANNPNFSKMKLKKHANQLLSVDFLDVENKICIEESIDYTDIAFISARPDLLPTYKELAFAKKKLIVVTLGSKGSYSFFNGNTYFQPAIKVPKVVDTTGCGDAYQATFALTYFRTQNIEKSMFEGAVAASKIVQAWGGVGSI